MHRDYSNYKINTVDIDLYYVTKRSTIDLYDNIDPRNKNPQLFAWGLNLSGGLGLGDTISRSSPVQVGSLANWKSLATYGGFVSYGYAIKTDGTLWSWGDNSNGNLGDGSINARSSPVQVGTLSNWNTISSETGGAVAAVKTDGTLWAWGANTSGQLGLGDTISRSSPVQVGSLTNWKSVSIASTTLAVKTDGTLWSWGSNGAGGLGQGLDPATTLAISSPVQVGSLTNWKQVSVYSYSATSTAVLAIKTDGTLWSWGDNSSGVLGTGDTSFKSSPVQVGSLTNWKQVNVICNLLNRFATALAIKTDGTLWSWGLNNLGELAQGDTISRSSPVQVGKLNNWKYIDSYTGGNTITGCTVFAIKADGTLWSWGSNANGRLGIGLTSSALAATSSPVQVGSLTNWKRVFGTLAISDGLE